MTSRGDIGVVRRAPARAVFCLGQFTRDKQPTSVTVTITGAQANGSMTLFVGSAGHLKKTIADKTDVDGTGTAYFYDLDDGTYLAFDSNGTAWDVTVSGASTTVTLRTSGAQVMPSVSSA